MRTCLRLLSALALAPLAAVPSPPAKAQVSASNLVEAYRQDAIALPGLIEAKYAYLDRLPGGRFPSSPQLTAQAEAVLAKARADQDVIRMKNEAEAEVLGGKVQALGSGINLARYSLYEKVGPRIRSVLTSDGPEGLGGIFQPYLVPGKEGGR